MKLNSHLTGTRLKPYTTDISWRQTTNFAAAISDRNPVYFDDRGSAGEAGLVAPPTFPVAVTWPVLSRLGEFIDSDEFPKNVLLTQVHYTEHLIIHRLIRPGDSLTLSGEIIAILPHRAGTHAVIKLAATDHTGQPVFTEYIGAMLRGVECEGEAGRDALPVLPEFDPETTPVWTSPQTIDPLAPYIYDGCTDIEFPIHTSPQFAAQVGLPGIILQGTATLTYAVRDMVANEAGSDPSTIKEIACSFTGMVMPGTDIEICCLGSRHEERYTHLFFEVINANNKKAIRNGYMKIKRTPS